MKNEILKIFLDEINKRIFKYQNNILAEIKAGSMNFFMASDTYKSLTEGELRGHFGFVAGEEHKYVDPILITFINSIHTFFIPFKGSPNKITGSFTIRGIESSYRDVLSLPNSVVENVSKKYPGGLELPWLEWLLLKGVSIPSTSDGPINSHIVFGDFKLGEGGRPDPSRSKIALMYQGGSWHVPVEYAGTQNDNWASRTVLDDAFTRMILTILEKYLL